MTEYVLGDGAHVIKSGTTRIPTADDPPGSNTHPLYLEYLEWVAQGNEPIPPEPPSIEEVQQWRDGFEVSRFQARAALHIAGRLASIEAYMADPETDTLVKLAWQDAQVFRRMSPSVLALQPMLSMTDTQLDDFFLFAGTITA